MSHPLVVRWAVIELGDDLLAVLLGPRQAEAVRDQHEAGPVVVGHVHLGGTRRAGRRGERENDVSR